ncbi:unnamed protein product [Notodromas monacha]|uniref:Carboxylic ester hydrolase n=1 Tax=Notodromas monacha TaxID=399045 RepID=A0A7R9GBU2_9CRUS|nr:unnamed protein product [Notodromas monacha]CAG0915413.1 unnamed protein product [Notodromas monacha]
MSYIHGGGYVFGDGNVDPWYFIDREEIVFVSFNYRLGSLGFAYSDHPSINLSGNYGIKDQIQALKWVQKTISAFGGDPNNVSIIGVSAGGSSVHDLLLVPHETQGLIHKAISVSGAALCPWAIQKRPNENFLQLAKLNGCLEESAVEPNAEALECIKALDAETLATAWWPQLSNRYSLPFVFVPVENDGDIFKGTKEQILSSGSFLQIPWLAGNARDEGSLIVGDSLSSQSAMDYLSLNWQDLCPGVMDLSGIIDSAEVTRLCEEIAFHYMGNEQISFDNYYNYLQMGGDRLFEVPMQRSAILHSKFAPFYGYRYNYQSIARSYLNYFNAGIPDDVPHLSSGVFHADNYALIFNGGNFIIPGDADEFVQNLHLGSLLNFIKTGVPTIPTNLVDYDLVWPTFSEDAPNIQVIDTFPRTTKNFVGKAEDEFWSSLGL